MKVMATWNEHDEDRLDRPCDAYRTVLGASWERGLEVGVYHQYRFRRSFVWDTSHVDIFATYFHTHWRWGSHHCWYDGPHCRFSLGFVTLRWGSTDCKKCMPED